MQGFKRFAMVLLIAVVLASAQSAFAIEGCKWCMKVELWQTAYVRCEPEQDCEASLSPLTCQNPGCSQTSQLVPKEEGEKCSTIDGTQDVSAILQADHQISSSMTDWLNWRLTLPAGWTGPDSYFSPYSLNAEGYTSCSSSYSNENRTTTVGNGAAELTHTVKVWTCNPSGSYCENTVTVQP